MSTIEDDNFDYQAYMKATPPDSTRIRRGAADRQHRLDAAMMRLTVRIEEELLHQFRQLIPEGQSCERLINQALRDWLAAKGMKELIRAEIQEAVHQSLSAQSRREFSGLS